MAMPKPITWLTEILRILQRAGIRVQFIRLYRDGQDEVGIILGGLQWRDVFGEETKQ